MDAANCRAEEGKGWLKGLDFKLRVGVWGGPQKGGKKEELPKGESSGKIRISIGERRKR